MVLNFFKGSTPNQYAEVITPLNAFMSGSADTLATLRSLIDAHLKSITKETPTKTAKRSRVRQDFFSPNKQGTNGTNTVTPPTVTSKPPHPPSTISPSDMDTKHVGEAGDDNKEEKNTENTDEEGENPLNPAKKKKLKPALMFSHLTVGQGQVVLPGHPPPLHPSGWQGQRWG
jgi:hypothetical protein